MTRPRPKLATYAVLLFAAACADGSAGILEPVALGSDAPPPTASVGGPYTGAVGVPVAFDARNSYDGAGSSTTLRYGWDFGDGASGEGVAPMHPYAAPGRYEIGLVVTDSRGEASARAVGTVTVMEPAVGDEVVLVGAGDIAECGSTVDDATAALLNGIAGTVFTLGDNAYPDGSLQQFRDCYAQSWGRHWSRTRPAVGNHEYNTPDAAGYFDYFGALAGDRDRGYYSYDVGSWHIIVLNSSVARGLGSAQERWLRADLATHPTACTLAYWHSPRFSSAKHGRDPSVAAFWDALYEAGAEIVLSGHDHVYERFAPQTPVARPDPQRGIRAFVVGTGGKTAYAFETAMPNSAVRNAGTPGVLKLTLRTGGYSWEFVPASGYTFRDAGTGTCH